LKRVVESVSVDLGCKKDCDSCERFFDCPEQFKWDVLERTGKPQRIRANLSGIKYKIAVTAGKGGVGKTLVTVNLAAALAMRGYKVAVLDQDFEGPNDHVMLGVKDMKLTVRKDGKIEPIKALLGIKVASMGNVLGADTIRSSNFEVLR
jgi:ATP-binding protein involved in chromosome partitioning